MARIDALWQHRYCAVHRYFSITIPLIHAIVHSSGENTLWKHNINILLSQCGGKIRYHVTASVLHASKCQRRACNPPLKRNSRCKVSSLKGRSCHCTTCLIEKQGPSLSKSEKIMLHEEKVYFNFLFPFQSNSNILYNYRFKKKSCIRRNTI